ncbi:MAG: hypothetical protein Q9227_002559 [Pyrenula ochraceoflavens]
MRFKDNVFNRTFIPAKFHPRGANFEPDLDGSENVLQSVKVELSKRGISPTFNSSFATKEAYKLTIGRDSAVQILAASSVGALHALQTLEQLFYGHSRTKEKVYCPNAPISIVDGPLGFEHRGINLDISRNWIPPEDVVRVIDAMAFNKLNFLHIHATDAQSWPLDIPSLPSLAQKGAYDTTQIWSAKDLHAVQQHGKLRGVSVYLEIDIPGHTTSIHHSHPDLITAAHREPWSKYAAEPPSGQLKLNHTPVQEFLTTVFNDLFPRIRSFSPYFHLGGDELNINAYSFETGINRPTKSNLLPLVQRLLSHALNLTTSHGFTPILWEEMLLEWNLTLPSSTVIQTWRSNAALAKVLQTGHRVLFGANTHWYLDCGHGAFLDPVDPQNPPKDGKVRPPYMDYCAPYHNWRHVYAYDPLAGISDPEQRRRVLGGEVHLWGELTDSVTLDGMLWPRAAAAAEMLWSGSGRTRVSEDVTRRLAEMRERLVGKGVRAGMVQMEWCLRNKGGCLL